MVKVKRMDVGGIFLGQQKQMRDKLNLHKKMSHSVAKGDAGEAEWKEFFKNLPARYQADKAFVIDCQGNVSDQIDIVIHDRQYSPFIWNHGGAKYIPAESVYAVFEVKPTMSKRHIIYASQKAASVRRLRRTSAPIVTAGGRIDKPKKPFTILAGILTREGNCTDTCANEVLRLKSDEVLNFGCSLDHVAFLIRMGKNRKVQFEKSDPDQALIFFLFNLIVELQRLGTVPAIDLREYLKAIRRK